MPILIKKNFQTVEKERLFFFLSYKANIIVENFAYIFASTFDL